MSRRFRMGLAGGVLVVIVALAWFFLISPLRADLAQTSEDIKAEQTKLAAAQAKLAQAEVTRAEGQKNQARLMELAKMVPDSSEVPSLLIQIQDLADQSGITFESMNPGEPKESGGFKIVPLTLTFKGTYFNLYDFAYRAERLVAGPGRLLTLKSVQLSPIGAAGGTEAAADGEDTTLKKEGESPNLQVAMTLYAFCMNQAEASETVASKSNQTAKASSQSGGATGSSATDKTVDTSASTK
jgi:type IV pilus assembly protein PilO